MRSEPNREALTFYERSSSHWVTDRLHKHQLLFTGNFDPKTCPLVQLYEQRNCQSYRPVRLPPIGSDQLVDKVNRLAREAKARALKSSKFTKGTDTEHHVSTAHSDALICGFSAPPRPLSPDSELLMAGITTENINFQTENYTEHHVSTAPSDVFICGFSAPHRPLSPDSELLMAGITTENNNINFQTEHSTEQTNHNDKTVSVCVNAEPNTLDKWIQ